MRNFTLYCAQLHPKKKLFTQFFLNNSNSVRFTKLKLAVHIVGGQFLLLWCLSNFFIHDPIMEKILQFT